MEKKEEEEWAKTCIRHLVQYEWRGATYSGNRIRRGGGEGRGCGEGGGGGGLGKNVYYISSPVRTEGQNLFGKLNTRRRMR